jgi:urea carboxylase-associated protein 2
MTTKPANGVVHGETVPGARYWSMVIRRGFVLRIADPTGRANAATLLFNPYNLTERYNMADTLKGQHTSKLTKGHMLYSDMGRVLMSIVEDTLGWHDPIGGISTPEDVRRQYGESSYQHDRNAFYRSGRELFLIELAKWGLGREDLVPCVNFFSRVYAGADGVLEYAVGHGKPNAYVELRAEMDTLVVLNTAPHPLNPAREYAPGPVELTIRRAAPVRDDDYCVGFRSENARAFANTAIYNCQLDGGNA